MLIPYAHTHIYRSSPPTCSSSLWKKMSRHPTQMQWTSTHPPFNCHPSCRNTLASPTTGKPSCNFDRHSRPHASDWTRSAPNGKQISGPVNASEKQQHVQKQKHSVPCKRKSSARRICWQSSKRRMTRWWIDMLYVVHHLGGIGTTVRIGWGLQAKRACCIARCVILGG